MIGLEEFEKFLKAPNDCLKPVEIFLSDGGPDENPRYQKRISIATVAIFVATNAPGRSAFNPVEKRMAPNENLVRANLTP